MATKEVKISDLRFDDKNFNKHTEFGMSLIEKSLRKNGAGRSILIDKNNRIIGGNGVVENAGQIGMEDVIVVETDGTKLVAVKRTDVDLDTQQGREMALADNATAAADLEWDVDAIADVESELDIDASAWGVDVDLEEIPTELDAEKEDADGVVVRISFPTSNDATKFITSYKDTLESIYNASISSL